MLKIPATDGNTYTAVSWTTFQAWRKRAVCGFIFLALATTAGVWGGSKHAADQLKQKINTYASASCTGGKVTINKYNDLVQSIIDGRVDQLNAAREQHNQEAIDLHQRAIDRYEKDFITPPTPAQCRIPILK